MQARGRSLPLAMRFTINLASAEQPAEGILRVALGLLVVFLLMLVVAEGLAWQAARRRLIALDAGSRRVAMLQARVPPASSLPASLEASVTAINGLIARKAFSWTGFLTDLEQAVPPKIAIQRVSPRWELARVELGGEAATLKDLAALIIALEQAPAFDDAFLSQQRMHEDGVVEFSLHVRYTGGAVR